MWRRLTRPSRPLQCSLEPRGESYLPYQKCSTAQCSIALHTVMQNIVVWCGVMWCDAVQFCTVNYRRYFTCRRGNVCSLSRQAPVGVECLTLGQKWELIFFWLSLSSYIYITFSYTHTLFLCISPVCVIPLSIRHHRSPLVCLLHLY